MANTNLGDIVDSGLRNVDFYAGWHSMQLAWMLKVYVSGSGSRQNFTNLYLSALRPEIVKEMIRVADELFPPGPAKLVKQFKEEWDGTE